MEPKALRWVSSLRSPVSYVVGLGFCSPPSDGPACTPPMCSAFTHHLCSLEAEKRTFDDHELCGPKHSHQIRCPRLLEGSRAGGSLLRLGGGQPPALRRGEWQSTLLLVRPWLPHTSLSPLFSRHGEGPPQQPLLPRE